MLYYNNILCVEASKLINSTDNPEGVISKCQYDGLFRYHQTRLVRRSSRNTPALIEFDTLPSKYKTALIQRYGDPREVAAKKPFRERIQPDPKALEYFSAYTLQDGRKLPQTAITQYCNDASILNAIREIFSAMQNKRAALGGTRNFGVFWTNACKAVNDLRVDYPCTLPDSDRRLKDRYFGYLKSGYQALISKKYCNDNSRKVSDQIESLLLSIYSMPNKPYGTSVHELYLQFVRGQINIYDKETGEIFNREDFTRGGQPIEISESTVWNYINQLTNRITVDSKRSSGIEFNDKRRPHYNRTSPMYSFSKVSLDDRDLPRLMVDGNRVKAYYAYDVASGCVIGKAYSRNKDRELFIDCMRDMFRLIEANGFGAPMEIEVEHHLVNLFKDTLAQAGHIFQFVRWCAPGNSIEKRAEHFNKAKKYTAEKNTQVGIGRWYARLEANRPKVDKVNNEFKERRFTYAQLVADDLDSIKIYNNSLHPRQKKYPGLTRWQVLCRHLNPNLANVDKSLLYKYIGEKTLTSIRRSQYCTVQNAKYQIEKPEILSRLLPGNYEVEAYWLPDANGVVDKVYLYQNDKYVCEATIIVAYNEATCEQTDFDREQYTIQSKYISHFDKFVKDRRGKLSKARVMESSELAIAAAAPVEIIDPIASFDALKELEEDLAAYDPEEYRQRAKEQL